MAKFTSDKIEGRLRAIGRGSLSVNAARAEFSGGVRVASETIIRREKLVRRRDNFDASLSIKNNAAALKKVRPTKGDAAGKEIEVDAFLLLSDDQAPFKDRSKTKRRGRFCTIRCSLPELDTLAKDPHVTSIRLAETLKHPQPSIGAVTNSGPKKIAGTTKLQRKHNGGAKTLIGIIDVDGMDFGHPDFITKDNMTRFLRIWDQGGGIRNPPREFDYGSEIEDKHINAALEAESKGGLPATVLEPQSQRRPGSHGTHVASIAAGNSGLCPNAKIAAVLVSLPAADQDRRLSFYDTTRIVHAVEYLAELAECKGLALSINISLGTNGGPHDNSAPMNRWIDSLLTRSGCVVSVAAGNAGQEAPQHAQDIGFVMGRIHTSGQIAATGLEARLNWVVVGDQIEDISENELEIWYAPQDRISARLRTPKGDLLPKVAPGQFIKNFVLPGDKTVVSIFNELYDAGNGFNKISIYLTPFMNDQAAIGVSPGVWQVRLIGEQIRDGHYHGWIERDDPRELGRFQGQSFWRFPSFFADDTNVDDSSISTLACGERIVSVANLDAAAERINVSSSQGPTRDGRTKPDIAAPGTSILAANGFDPDARWIEMTGTSMSSPYVAGVAGLMLSINDTLTAAQIIGIIRRTASPLPGRSFDWQNDSGFGVINVEACLDEALNAGDMEDVL